MTIEMFDAADTTAAAHRPRDAEPPVATCRLSVTELQEALRHLNVHKSEPAAAPTSSDAGSAHAGRAPTGPTAKPRDAHRSQRNVGQLAAVSGRLTPRLAAQLHERRARHRPPSVDAALVTPPTSTAPSAWMSHHPVPQPIWVRAGGWLIPAALLVLVAVGALTMAGRVAAWITGPDPGAVAPAVPADVRFAGTAEAAALDYLTWDSTDRPVRAAAIAAWATDGQIADGWDGAGRLTADAATAVDVMHCDTTTAVVSVRVRVTALATPSLWVLLAVRVSTAGSGAWVSGTPVLVGSPPSGCVGAAVTDASAEDPVAAAGTAGTVAKLVTAFAAGDLEFVRTSTATFEGLKGAARSGTVNSWTVAAPSADGADRRSGDVTVVWDLGEDSGSLTGSYRLELVRVDGRWLLADITPLFGSAR